MASVIHTPKRGLAVALLLLLAYASSRAAEEPPVDKPDTPGAQVTLVVPDRPAGVPWTPAIPDRPSTQRHAAEYLQLLLEAATGAKPAIVAAAEEPRSGMRIYVGYGPHLEGKVTPPTKPEGLKVESRGGVLYLLGEIAPATVNNWPQPTDRGLVHAVETYAERVLGYRFLFATLDKKTRKLDEFGTVVPRIEAFTIPDGLLIEDAPAFAHRVLSSRPRDLIGLRTGSAPAFTCNHSYNIDWWAQQFGKKNPEMFIPKNPARPGDAKSTNGEATAAMASQPNLRFLDYTEPLLLQKRLDNYEQFFKTGKGPGFYYNPTHKYMVEETIDAPAPTVQYNERSRALFNPKHHAWGNFSNIWFDYLNRMSAAAKQRWPDRNLRIATLAYMRHYGLPTFPLADNIDVMMTVMRTTMGCKEAFVLEKNRKDVEGWYKHLGSDRNRLFLWEYGCWPAFWVSVPILTPNAHQRWLKAVQPMVSGSFIEMYDPNEYYFLMRYLWARLLWNPDLDVKAEVADACRHFFGPAGGTMTAFYLRLIERCERPWDKPDLVWDQYMVNPRLHFGQSFPPEQIKELARMLEQARREAGLPAAFATELEFSGSAVYAMNLETQEVPARFSVRAIKDAVPDPAVVWDGGRLVWRGTLQASERLDLDGEGAVKITDAKGASRSVEIVCEGDWPKLAAGEGRVFHFFQLGAKPAKTFIGEVRYGATDAPALTEAQQSLFARRLDWLYGGYGAMCRRQFAGATAGLLADATMVHRFLGKAPSYVVAAAPAKPANVDDEAWRAAPMAELVRGKRGGISPLDTHGYPAAHRLRFQVLHAAEGLAFRLDAEGAPEAGDSVTIALNGKPFSFEAAKAAATSLVTDFRASETGWIAVALVRWDKLFNVAEEKIPESLKLQIARTHRGVPYLWSPPVGFWESGVQGDGALNLALTEAQKADRRFDVEAIGKGSPVLQAAPLLATMREKREAAKDLPEGPERQALLAAGAAAYAEALKLHPGYLLEDAAPGNEWALFNAHKARGDRWLALGEGEKARAEYRALGNSVNKKNLDLRSYIEVVVGDSYLKERNYIEAEAAYKKATSIGLFGDRKKQVPAKLAEVAPLAEAQRAAGMQ